MFKKLNLSMLVAASVASASAFAAYGPAPAATSSASAWTLGLGYGQMFGMKKTTLAQASDFVSTSHSSTHAKVDKPTVFEVDLFNRNNGFGAIYMTSAKKKEVLGINAEGVAAASPFKYSFDAYFLGYQKPFASNMNWRVGVGMSDQKIDDVSAGSEFAWLASASYSMPLSDKVTGALEVGYLDQKEVVFNATDKVSGTGFYAKFVAKMDL